MLSADVMAVTVSVPHQSHNYFISEINWGHKKEKDRVSIRNVHLEIRGPIFLKTENFIYG